MSRYVEKRNELIPEAEKEANRVAGPKPKKECGEDALWSWGQKWSRVFHRTMNTLAKERWLTA